jgi:hypothetical protein
MFAHNWPDYQLESAQNSNFCMRNGFFSVILTGLFCLQMICKVPVDIKLSESGICLPCPQKTKSIIQ